MTERDENDETVASVSKHAPSPVELDAAFAAVHLQVCSTVASAGADFRQLSEDVDDAEEPGSGARTPTMQDVEHLQDFLAKYRSGTLDHDVATQPKALRIGGHTSAKLREPELRKSARFFEQNGYLRAPQNVRKQRLLPLRRLDLPNSAATAPGLQSIVDLTASMLQHLCPDGTVHAFVSIVDDEKQTIVAASDGSVVAAGHQDPSDMSLCSHAILAKSTLSLPDIKTDWRFKNNPYSVSGVIAAYAGTPVSIQPDPDAAAVDGGGKARARPDAELEPIGTLCVYSNRPTKDLTDDDLATLADLAELTGAAIEGSYAIGQRGRETAVRQSLAELLTLPFDVVAANTPSSTGRKRRNSDAITDTSSIDVSSNSTSSTLATALDTAAASLREHLHADAVVLLDPKATATERVVLGRSHPLLGSTWSTPQLVQLVAEVQAAEGPCFLPSATGLPSRAGIIPLNSAILALPVADLDGEPRLVILAHSDRPDALFGKTEQAYANLIGQVLLGCLVVDRLLLTSSAAASFVSQVSHELRHPCYILKASLEQLRESTPVDALPALEPLLSTAETCCNSVRWPW